MICANNERNISGLSHGKLTAIKRDWSRTGKEIFWWFHCECGNLKSMNKKTLTQKRYVSCGCAQKEVARKSMIKYNKSAGHELHGNGSHELYAVWKSMKGRCYNKKSADYNRYGGRGIVVCDRWIDSFSGFLDDMGERPEGSTIDRIDNDGNYEPSNCRWATMKTQCSNRSTSREVEINGTTYPTIREASERTGLSVMQIRYRYCGLREKMYPSATK